jgi:hypothetical protein
MVHSWTWAATKNGLAMDTKLGKLERRPKIDDRPKMWSSYIIVNQI